MKITTAIIFAAGYGRRMLPITAAVQKELLPILDRPVIDYVVDDCVSAGIKNIIFIVRQGSSDLQNYYLRNNGLEAYLGRTRKTEDLERLNKVHHKASYSFVEQPADAERGTAVVAAIGYEHVPKGEPFLICDGDAFSWHSDGHSEAAAMIELFEQSGAGGILLAREVPADLTDRYGILQIDDKEGREYLRDFVEKPAEGTAPSNLANLSKYLVTPAVMEYVKAVEPDEKSGERYLPAGIRDAARHLDIAIHRSSGEFLDVGSLESWLHANLIIGENDPRTRDILK